MIRESGLLKNPLGIRCSRKLGKGKKQRRNQYFFVRKPSLEFKRYGHNGEPVCSGRHVAHRPMSFSDPVNFFSVA